MPDEPREVPISTGGSLYDGLPEDDPGHLGGVRCQYRSDSQLFAVERGRFSCFGGDDVTPWHETMDLEQLNRVETKCPELWPAFLARGRKFNARDIIPSCDWIGESRDEIFDDGDVDWIYNPTVESVRAVTVIHDLSDPWFDQPGRDAARCRRAYRAANLWPHPSLLGSECHHDDSYYADGGNKSFEIEPKVLRSRGSSSSGGGRGRTFSSARPLGIQGATRRRAIRRAKTLAPKVAATPVSRSPVPAPVLRRLLLMSFSTIPRTESIAHRSRDGSSTPKRVAPPSRPTTSAAAKCVARGLTCQSGYGPSPSDPSLQPRLG